ncbi:furin-like protease 1 isoform X1 [Microplitis demolitor]|uniref:furin-like protease 1 isoform X1 n=1 Tax=Microplitis demolitor TaxID=69319 RepID=UPI0004CDCEFD|nr:furin-like protease 1 isoform X1 [Microplitis demolitor]XP_053593633.1 furin-like protease 1 isoform X1 [Microplitis demolitor]
MCINKWMFSVSLLLLVTIDNRTRAYSNQWTAQIRGGPDVAQRVAMEHGFHYRHQIFEDLYHFDHKSVKKRSSEPHLEINSRLKRDTRVQKAEQQRILSRRKRDFVVKRGPASSRAILNDDRWPQMWYLNRGKGLDMNVQGAWADGITGHGIVVTILDDGLEKDHPDIYSNYDPQASYDVNSYDDDPMPRYDYLNSNRHGTRCAGEVAATANNSFCAVGVAYGAGVGGVRMLDGEVTDAVEARSLSFNSQHIDIYSASWGPDDDGKTVDGPGELATRAFIEGITKGRSGKGSIFVWASGNGGREHDNCNCDGYTNSIWTLSISSATENGLVPWYSEACSSTLATAYSSGSLGEKQIVTIDLNHQCTSSHTGTSASAPIAAGICALALEANKDLTWRDMQHIVVRTAKPANLIAADWTINGVGRNVSHSFGYGLMDATAMVQLAKKWQTVPEQHKCEMLAPHKNRSIPSRSQLTLDFHVKECSGVNFLEHVQAKITLSASRRGDLEITLTSPQGTKSTLLAKRPHDNSKTGFQQWPFMSVHTWGERPHGTWKLEVHNEGRYVASLTEWGLMFYGTETALKFDDELDKDKPIAPIEIDIPHNNGAEDKKPIDTEGDDDLWTGRQQVDLISHPEVQKPTTENHTSKACNSFGSHGCLECKDGWFISEGRCLSECPRNMYVDHDQRKNACIPCHYSCMTCSGPSDIDCTSCHADSNPIPLEMETFQCILKSIEWKTKSTVWFYRMTIVLGLSSILMIGIVIYLWISSSKKLQKIINQGYMELPLPDDQLKDGNSNRNLDRYQSESE